MTEETSTKDLILQLTGVSGEMSQTALSRIPCTDSYREKCLYQLKKDGLIREIDRDELIGLRLTAKGKHYLEKTFLTKFTGIFADNNGVNKIRLTKASRLRAMRTSEVLSFLFLCGVDVFCANRPPLEQPLADVKQTFFYSSYEIKAFSEEGRKMSNARFNGLLKGTSKNSSCTSCVVFLCIS